MKYSDLEDAFMYVSMGPMFQNMALVHRVTGEVYCVSEYSDDFEVDDDRFEDDDYIGIPHKNDLELGTRLIFDFISRFLPDDYDAVRTIFSRRGAYARYRDFLERRDMLEAWYTFEAERIEAALREWAAQKGIVLTD